MVKIRVSEGVERETLAIGDRLMIVEFSFRRGSDVPWHSHVHEQSSYIVKGRLKLFIEEDELILTPGMSAIVPSNARHKAVAVEDTVDINAFAPVREDYL
jgi:quercetin dioxygenase-like cupin family protein